MRKPARAETVGSLLRPPRLRSAIDAFYAPGHSAVLDEERAKDRSALRALEDEAIRAVVQRQVDAGLDVLSDGELRRWMFMNSFYDAVEGVRTDKTVRFHKSGGGEVELRVHEIVDRLRPVDSPAAREATFLAEVTGPQPFKVTFPAASIFGHPLTTVGDAYDSLDAFVTHAIEIERGLVADAIEAGARYVQFDFPLYPYLVDPIWIERFFEAGFELEPLVDAAIAADRAVLADLPDDVTTALHICRGNYRSSWMCEGSLEPVAERILGELPYDVFLVEWDDLGRDGGFEPIRYLRPSSIVVMGLISTKTPELEKEDDVLRRMEAAAAIVGGIERLAISPQCGFASVMVGNELTEDDQWRKLDLVGSVAARLWG
ncbi:MAG TPA: cobalamin-independent methionine synthase II family protein [Actinomycetota bacterium]|nr:cobalamin-independent methionine synthase II family protein [Actinomycetota bacterium]